MSLLAEITEKLLEGRTPEELIKLGYARSSVYRQAAQLKKSSGPGISEKVSSLEKELSSSRARASLLEEQNNKLSSENLQLARMLGQAENQIKLLTAPKEPWYKRLFKRPAKSQGSGQ